MNAHKIEQKKSASALEEEIDFINIVKIFIKRKKLFWGSFLFFLCLGLIYTFLFYTPKYQYSIYLQTAGYYQQTNFIPLQDPEKLDYVLQKIYAPEFVDIYNASHPQLQKISIRLSDNNKNLIKVDIITKKMNTEIYTNIFQSFLSMLNHQESSVFDRTYGNFQEKINFIRQQLIYLANIQSIWKNQFINNKALNQQAVKMADIRNQNVDSLLSQYILNNSKIKMGDSAYVMADLNQRLVDLQYNLSSLEKTHIFNKIPASVTMASPNLVAMIFMMIIGAFLITISLMLTIEFFTHSLRALPKAKVNK
ncbi:MAG: hypothetical protein JW855_01835 [Gammaproteobacteria bacterium]|nr:hypothetical protein [Gammaproteobacteria bacterium]